MLCRLLLAALCLAAPISGVVDPVSGVAGINARVTANQAVNGKLVVILFETSLCSMYASKALQGLTALSTSTNVGSLVEVLRCDVTSQPTVISTFGIGGVPTIKVWWQGRGPATYTGGRTLAEFEEMVRLSQGPSLKTMTAPELNLGGTGGALAGTKANQLLGSYVVGVNPGLSANRLANIEMVAHNRRNRAIFVRLPAVTGNDVILYGRDGAPLMTPAPAAVTITIEDLELATAAVATAAHIATVSDEVDKNTYALVADMSTIAYARLLERDLVICWAFLDPENPSGGPVAVDAATKTNINTAIVNVANLGKVGVIQADGRFWHHKALEMIPTLKDQTDPRGFLPAMACEYNAQYVSPPIADMNKVITTATINTLLGNARALSP